MWEIASEISRRRVVRAGGGRLVEHRRRCQRRFYRVNLGLQSPIIGLASRRLGCDGGVGGGGGGLEVEVSG